MIRLSRNTPLKHLNTFRLEAAASAFLEVDHIEDLKSWLDQDGTSFRPFLVLGGGSNILFTQNFEGTVIRPVNNQVQIISEEDSEVRILAGAGAGWDPFVEWCVKRNFGGLENLSLIPGTVGAAPIQNIGAYGNEVAAAIESVRVLDLLNGNNFLLANEECGFGYRTSIFKKPENRNLLVWEVVFSLQKDPIINLSYEPLKNALAGKELPAIADIRNSVIRIRESKLPDPAEIGNAGSFYKNPVVPACMASLIRKDYPDMPLFIHNDTEVKIPAGWLIEKSGWKGYREGPVGVYPQQALVLVNYGGATAQQILGLAGRIEKSVKERFGIGLEMEVRVI